MSSLPSWYVEAKAKLAQEAQDAVAQIKKPKDEASRSERLAYKHAVEDALELSRNAQQQLETSLSQWLQRKGE